MFGKDKNKGSGSTSTSESSSSSSLLKGRWTVWILALIFALLAALGILMIISRAADRVVYYVTATNLPARTQISLSNVEKVEVNTDGVPVNALTEQEVASGQFFTKIALPLGTPVVAGVVGGQTPITYNLPSGYVAASIQVSPDRAVAGKIKTGDYIDIAAVNEDVSKIILQNILVLDVTVNPSSIPQSSTSDTSLSGEDASANAGPESQQIRSGIPQVYTLAVSPENFTRLALLNGNNVLLALAQQPPQNSIDAQTSLNDMFSPGGVSNGGVGTEDVFTGSTEGEQNGAGGEIGQE